MAAFRLTASPRFPEDTLVSAFSAEIWGGPPPLEGDKPAAEVTSSGIVDKHGFALIEGLDDDTPYYFGALVEGRWKWKSGRTPPVTGAGTGTGGPGGLNEAQVNARVAAGVSPETAARIAGDASLAATIAGLPTSSGLTAEQVEEIVEALAPVTAKRWTLGPTSGAVTMDLRKGHFWVVSSSGTIKVNPPSNPPTGTGSEIIEAAIRIEGANPIELVGIVWEGEPLPLSPAESEPITIPLESVDGGATWHAIGGQAPPPDVPRVLGTPTNLQGMLFDTASGKWKPATLATLAEAKALAKSEGEAAAAAAIVTSAVQNGTGGPQTVTGTNAAGMIPYGTSASNMTMTSLAALTASNLIPTEVSSATALLTGHYYRSTTALTHTLPTGAGVAAGAPVVVENATAGAGKIKGKFTFGSETETTRIMHAGEVLTFTPTAEGKYWRVTSGVATPVQANEAIGGYTAATIAQRGASLLAAPVSKQIHICKFLVPSSIPFSKLAVYVGKAGATLTYFAAAVIQSSGVSGGFTADEHVAVETTGLKIMNLGGGSIGELVGGPGVYAYFALLCIGTTPPELTAAPEAVGGNRQLSAGPGISNSSIVAGIARTTAGESNFTTLEPPTVVDLSKSQGKGADFPLFFGALAE